MATSPQREDNPASLPEVHAVVLGRRAYGEVLELQRDRARALRNGEAARQLLLYVEHAPVITRGRTSRDIHVLGPPGGIEASGIELHEVERGGDVTYHGPGQIVGYPILDLKQFRQDLHWYLRQLEETLISALGALGIEAFRAPPHTGVWVGEPSDEPESLSRRVETGTIRKIASIGVHASRWVTWHGYALNHTRESLDGFSWIVPCGIAGVRMTSIESEREPVERREVISILNRSFEASFNARVRVESEE